MKRFILYILLIFSVNYLNVSASELIITTPGTIDNSFLEKDDYIISEEINWKDVGEFEINYFDSLNKTINATNIHITNLQNLETGYHYKKESIYSISSNIVVNKILTINENDYFIIGSIDTKYYPYQSQDEQMFSYISYYKDNVKQWQRVLNENRYGEVVDAQITNQGIALICNYDSISQAKNIIIYIITFNNKIIFEKELFGSANDIGKNIYFLNNYIYIVGMTNSNDNNFKNNINASGYVVFVSKINIINSNIDTIFIGNNENNVLFNSEFYKGTIYLYMLIQGDGYFNNNTSNNYFKTIIEIDNQFNIGTWVDVNNLEVDEFSKLFIYNNYIFLSENNLYNNKLKFQIFSLRLNYVDEFIIDEFKNATLLDYNFLEISNNLVISLIERDVYNLFNKKIILLDNELNIISIYVNQNIDLGTTISNISNCDNKLIISFYNKQQDKYEILLYYNIKVKKELIRTSKYDLTNYKVYINNVETTKVKLTDTAPINAFGNYYDIYLYEYGNLKIYLKNEKYYFFKSNISNDEVFDKGIIINFNGVGYLNDKLIDQNYKINDAGKYILEVIGEGEKKIINFKIDELSLELDTIDLRQSHEDNIKIISKESSIVNQTGNTLKLINNIEEEVDSLVVVIIFSFIIIGILGGLFLPIRIRRQK